MVYRVRLSGVPLARALAVCAVLTSITLFCTRVVRPLPKIQAAELRSATAPQENSHRVRSPILVELFTSEGCSSCPPADALLARLDRDQPVPNADIVVLGEHVDYWDRLGWKDRFSSHDFTQRQTDYGNFFRIDDIYTPQTIVNGSAQFNGTDAAGIEKTIAKAASAVAVPLQFTGVRVHDNVVTFTLRNGPATAGYVNVYAALVDLVDSTVVRSGENAGQTLHHVGIARQLNRVGTSVRTDAVGKGPFTLQTKLRGTLDNMRLVVFVQTKQIGPILGTVACSLGRAESGRQTASFDPCPVPAS